MVYCHVCGAWWHPSCAGVEDAKVFRKHPDLDSEWTCPFCCAHTVFHAIHATEPLIETEK